MKRMQKLKDAAKNAQRWDENRLRKKALAHMHERIANRHSDFAHKRSCELVHAYQVIVFEDLAPLEMGRNRGMRTSIMDVAWSQVISMTVVKAAEAGRRVILANPRNTSKMCSSCGELVQKTLSERVHSCPHCGLVMGRDQNAALNILHRGLQLGSGHRWEASSRRHLDRPSIPWHTSRTWEPLQGTTGYFSLSSMLRISSLLSLKIGSRAP